MTDPEPVLVTGAAGFIGFHVARRVLEAGRTVVGLDNFDPYYDVRLKQARVEQLAAFKAFRFERIDIADRAATAALFAARRFASVVHLAARAGVRHSLEQPHAYADANVTGFLNVLEGCRTQHCRHLVYASSSSVYGANTTPFSTAQPADHPLSLYGATKRANELMAHAYAHLFAVPMTGLRFFTIYGPWGRPDMAMWRFTAAVFEGRPVPLFNHGRMRRDFTYIDDAVEAVMRILGEAPGGDPRWSGEHPDAARSRAPWRLYNIGNSRPVGIEAVLRLIEQAAGRAVRRELLPMQPGDVAETRADVADLERDFGFHPSTPIEEGVKRFVAWYRDHRRGRSNPPPSSGFGGKALL
jgi:UDP-glucuronate 4-epimerase